MKRLLLLILIIGILCTGCAPAIVLAEETTNANQEVDIDAAGAVALFLKQPRAAENTQVIKIHRSGLVFLLSIAGKVPAKTESESK